YHGPGPYIDRLIFKYVPDLTVLFTQLKTGEIDVTGLQGIPVDLYPEAKTLTSINLYVDPSTSYETIAPNHLLPMFKDKRMRQALYLAMDKKPIVEKIWLGLAPEAESYVPPQSWAYNPKIKGRHTYDPERAKTLLDEIGWKVGADGIRVKGGMGRNSVASESPEIDRLLEAGVRDIDREKRKKAYFRLQEVYADELPYLPIFHYVNIRGTRKGVQGFAPNSNMQEYSWNTNEWWIKKG